MLRPLLLLFALTAVPGAAGLDFSTSTQIDISSCPITFFGKTYHQLYVSMTELHIMICFDGFYNADTSQDCVIGPEPENPNPVTSQDIVHGSAFLSVLIQNTVPTITSTMTCYVNFALGNNFAVFLVNFGAEAVVGLNSNSLGTTTTDVLVNGKVADTLSVTNSKSHGQYYSFRDVSGCRFNGLVFASDTRTLLPDSCETIHCDGLGNVTEFLTCQPTQTCLGNNMCGSNEP